MGICMLSKDIGMGFCISMLSWNLFLVKICMYMYCLSLLIITHIA